MNHYRYFRKFGWLLLTILICGCGDKKPDDDVVLIKQALTKFERGINLQNQTVIDSLVLDNKINISSQLLDSLYQGGEFAGAQITSKSFIILKDNAEVRLGLRMKSEIALNGKEEGKIEKQIRLFLHKKRGNWKIRTFGMMPDEE